MTEANRMNAKESAPSRISGEALQECVLSSILERDNEAVEAIESIVRGDPIDAATPVRSELPFTVNPDGSKSFVTSWGGEYFITADGVEYAKEAGAKNRMRVCGRLEVVADIRTADGEDRRRLVRWTDGDGQDHEYQFSVAELLKPNAICSRLMAGSLRIDGQIKTQGGVAQLIADYLNQCPAPERYTGIPRFGWYGPAGEVFVLPENKIISSSKIEEALTYTGPDDGAPALSSLGTLKDWQDKVAMLAACSSRASFAVCVALAAPLLAFVAEDSGGFHFYGPSSRGKSTALRAACSVWASADTSGEMGSWRATDNGLEAVFEAHSDMPVILDEIGQAKSAEFMMELSYMLGNGTGKRRMSRGLRARKVAAWRSLFLSSGEITISEAAEREHKKLDAGVLVRMAHIPALPNGSDQTCGIFDLLPTDGELSSAGTVASRLNDAAKQRAYGTAGPAFVEKVVREVADKGREAFVSRVNEIVEGWIEKRGLSSDGQIGRVARRFALVAAAGELAIAYGVLPWQRGFASHVATECFDAWRAQFKTPEQEEPELIEHLLDQFIALDDQFGQYTCGVGLTSKRSPLKLLGYKATQDGRTVRVYVLPSEFVNLCKNREKKRTLEALSKRAYLYENDRGRHNYHYHRMPDGVPLQTAYIVLVDQINRDNGGEA